MLLAATETWFWLVLLIVGGLGAIRFVVEARRGRRPWSGTSPVITAHPAAFGIAVAAVIAAGVIWLIVQTA